MTAGEARRRSRVAEAASGAYPPASAYLLDVNVLIALIEPMHTHHAQAHDWFARLAVSAWATCPITQNGVIRIVGHSRYPQGPGSPAKVAAQLARFCSRPGHRFWADDASLLDGEFVESSRLLQTAQVTDTYLLALAVKHGGRLATFDKRLVADAVRGGAAALQVIE